MPPTKEPANLILQNEKRSDGSTLTPWSRGKPMASDVTVPDTYAESHTGDTATDRGRCSGEPGSGQQNCQIQWTGQHAHLLPSCHRNSRYLETLGCWAWPGNWQTGHIHHWQTQRIYLSVATVVSGERPPGSLYNCRESRNFLGRHKFPNLPRLLPRLSAFRPIFCRLSLNLPIRKGFRVSPDKKRRQPVLTWCWKFERLSAGSRIPSRARRRSSASTTVQSLRATTTCRILHKMHRIILHFS